MLSRNFSKKVVTCCFEVNLTLQYYNVYLVLIFVYPYFCRNVDEWARVSVFGPACPFGLLSNKYIHSFIHSYSRVLS